MNSITTGTAPRTISNTHNGQNCVSNVRKNTGIQPPVQRVGSNASTAGQGHKTAQPLSQVQLAEFARLQSEGYTRVGKKQAVKECETKAVIRDKVGLSINTNGNVAVCGMQTCKSRWCPKCWSKVANRRRDEVAQVAEWATSQGHVMVLVTLTASHVRVSTLDAYNGKQFEALQAESTTAVFKGLSGAWRYMHSGRRGKWLSDNRVGYIRAFELTTDVALGQAITGNHGHFHMVLVLPANADVERIKSEMWSRWEQGCRYNDLAASAKGFDFKILDGDDRAQVKSATTYIAKGEKVDSSTKIGVEIARGDLKDGRLTRRCSPESLLRSIGAMDATEYAEHAPRLLAHWRGIEDACHGRRWLTWSRELRDMAGLGAEQSDEAIMSEADHLGDGVEGVLLVKHSEIVDHLPELKRVINARNLRPRKAFELLVICLDSLGVDYELMGHEDWKDLLGRWVKAKYSKDASV